MLKTPLNESPLRDLFDIGDLVRMGDPSNRSLLRTFRDVVNSAQSLMTSDGGIKAVHGIGLCADGHLRLLKVGSRGGVYRLWDFGKL